MKQKQATKSLKSNFIYNFISQILTLIVPLITTPYLSRVLHEEGNGRFGFSSSIITYFVLFANLGFDMYGQRQIASCKNDEERSKVFWEVFILKTIFTSVALAVLYSIIFTVGFGENYNLLILILSLQVITIPFDIQYYFRGEENFKSIAIRTIIMRVVGLICIFVFVKTENDTWIYTLCYAVSMVFSNLIMWPSIIGKIKKVPPKQLELTRHLKPTLIIFLPTLAVTIYSVFDKTMIGLLAENPDYENGCYEQAYKINSVALLLVTIISSVMVSRNARDFSQGNMDEFKRHIARAIRYVWMMGLPLIVGFAVLSGNLSSWFLGDGYEEAPLLMQIMSVRFVISGLGTVFGDQLFIAARKEIYPTIATFVAAALNVGLNWVLIPRYGATGAAISTAVCEVTVTTILAILALAKKFVSLKTIFGSIWRYAIAAAVMFAPIFFMQKYLGNGIWQFILITFVGVLAYFTMLIILRDKFIIDLCKSVRSALKSKIQNAGHRNEGNAVSDNVAADEDGNTAMICTEGEGSEGKGSNTDDTAEKQIDEDK